MSMLVYKVITDTSMPTIPCVNILDAQLETRWNLLDLRSNRQTTGTTGHGPASVLLGLLKRMSNSDQPKPDRENDTLSIHQDTLHAIGICDPHRTPVSSPFLGVVSLTTHRGSLAHDFVCKRRRETFLGTALL